jgi:hypothetical protein
VARELFNCLVPGGRVAFDIFHSTRETAATLEPEWMERCQASIEGVVWTIYERARTEPNYHRIKLDIKAVPESVGLSALNTSMTLNAPPAAEWHDALIDAGFVDVRAWSGFDLARLTEESPESVWVATRPDY